MQSERDDPQRMVSAEVSSVTRKAEQSLLGRHPLRTGHTPDPLDVVDNIVDPQQFAGLCRAANHHVFDAVGPVRGVAAVVYQSNTTSGPSREPDVKDELVSRFGAIRGLVPLCLCCMPNLGRGGVFRRAMVAQGI